MTYNNYITYLISDGTAIKIGMCQTSVLKRLRALQVGNPRKLTLLGGFNKHNEKELHYKYKEFYIRGEWYNINIILDLIITEGFLGKDDFLKFSIESI